MLTSVIVRNSRGLLARPFIITIINRHPPKGRKIIPLHRRNAIFVRSGTQT
jgi:hypothetical protein